ncbi:histidine kinase 5 isoform X1 [Arabidopsis lyrata subsp. lyrata]|uniref:histidine kinase 5 isoform X1 n=1 Tax=Arabidopsis lyrata subsp. lyrata TaxID=81972 RepID=UPI000A29D5A5|nr:histidine kinase 5 isoform X1 [Arabidopsis lyrata subsp. lyrata]|eukprot:XP_020876721.1 histidine kinase 5 isoform X1 [Arabidopsis lyrata subsp. lyrata]
MLEASTERERRLIEKLSESLKTMESQSAPVQELTQNLKKAEGFLHFILQNAPIVMGHQDIDLRYLFIYNKYPSLREQDILGKTDVEIFHGGGIKEYQDFKREVLEKGKASKREITFTTDLFGSKTFLVYVEPVYNKAGEKIGINYMGMEVTEQVDKREKMAKLREDNAVRKAMESELNKTIHITEETMRAKQMLATMSHEIRSPLSGVVGMAEILSTTKLDKEQRQLLNVMISSGDLVLQLINDILDISKVESGVMKLEATKFRPREVVKHVLQTAAASLKKSLTLEGNIADDVPIEVVGDVLRIRQILTNLISNAIKFTHEGNVGIKLQVISEPSFARDNALNADTEEHEQNGLTETSVWICCDVWDTGIGIPENAIPCLFKKYMQASADHARKYGGTGLGLAICKQLVELMGGQLTVTSRVNEGSTFTFILPYKVGTSDDYSDDQDEFSDMADHHSKPDDTAEGYFQFKPLETDQIEEMDVEVLSSMWPEDVGTEADKQFNVEKPAGDLDTLKEVTIEEKLTIADLTRLPELLNSTPQGSSQLTNLMKQWEYMQHNAVRLLREELKNLNRQREEAEAKELKIIEEYKFESNEPENVSVLDETSDWFRGFRQKKRDVLVDSKKIEIYEEFDSKKVDDEENSDTVATSTDMNEAVNVEKSKEAEQEEAEVKEEESERRSNRNKRPS